MKIELCLYTETFFLFEMEKLCQRIELCLFNKIRTQNRKGPVSVKFLLLLFLARRVYSENSSAGSTPTGSYREKCIHDRVQAATCQVKDKTEDNACCSTRNL